MQTPATVMRGRHVKAARQPPQDCYMESHFNIGQFVRSNKVVFIWAAFGLLLYLFRDLFGLVFITYIMCFITYSITNALHRRLGLNRRLMVLAVYAIFLLLIAGFLFFVMPGLALEAKSFTDQLPRATRTIDAWIAANAEDNTYLVPVIEQAREYLTPEQLVFRGWAMARGLLEAGFHYASWFVLGLVFSFLIMMDLPRLVRGIRTLRSTRLAAVYEETADSVVLFARVVGENFRAQLMISALNTVLTAAGLLVLGINGVALLCTVVFVCGLVPVLGTFISSVPVFLMAVNAGGIGLGLWSIVMIIVISIAETYIFNPRIVGAIMHINPVMTLIILYVAHSLLGLWGMLLGVPIAVYVYRQITMDVSRHDRQHSPDDKENNTSRASTAAEQDCGRADRK